MRKFTKAHFNRKMWWFPKMLVVLKVIEPYTIRGNYYDFKVNRFNPLTYVFVLFVILSTVMMSLVSSTYLSEVFDEIHDMFSELPIDGVWVKDFSE